MPPHTKLSTDDKQANPYSIHQGFFYSLEEPLKNAFWKSTSYLISWIPESVRSTLSTLTSSCTELASSYLTELVEDLPPQQSVSLAWQAPYQGPAYWTAHCTTVIEDILEASDLSIEHLHQQLLNLQDCIGPRTLLPWALDRGLRALQQHYAARANLTSENASCFLLIKQHRAFLRDQLLKQPIETTQLLEAELQYMYHQWVRRECRWRDVVRTITDYARVLPTATLQLVFQALEKQLKALRDKGHCTSAEYMRGKRVVQKEKAHITRISLYDLRGTQFAADARVNMRNSEGYSVSFLSGTTLLFTAQAITGVFLPLNARFFSPENADLSSGEISSLMSITWLNLAACSLLSGASLRKANMASWSCAAMLSFSSLPFGLGQQTDCNGTIPSSEIWFNNDINYYLDIATLPQGGWIAVWDTRSMGIHGQLFAADGSFIGQTFQVNTYTGYQQDPVVATLTDGGWVVVWQSSEQDGSGYGIYGQRFGVNGSQIGQEFQVNTYTHDYQITSAIAVLQDGGWVVVWQSNGQDGSGYGIYGQRFGVDGSKIDQEFQVNTYTQDAQSEPAITALLDGSWVVVWYSFGQDGSGCGIYGQRFGVDGSKIDQEFQVNTYIQDSQLYPAIAGLSDGGWIVVWQSYNYNLATDRNYAQRFGTNGTRIGQEFPVNSYISGYQGPPAISVLSNGGWIIVWLNQDRSMYGQHYDVQGHSILTMDFSGKWLKEFCIDSFISAGTSGTPVVMVNSIKNSWLTTYYQGIGEPAAAVMQLYTEQGMIVAFSPQQAFNDTEFLVNTDTFLDQKWPAITTLANEGWVVVWQSLEQDGSSYGVYRQRFGLNGTAIEEEFQVAFDAKYPAVTVLVDGGWVVVWECDIYICGQRYNANGSLIGERIEISADGQSSSYPEIAGLINGGWVVVWQGIWEPNYVIDGQLYGVNGLKMGPPFQVVSDPYNMQEKPVVAALLDGGWVVVWQNYNEYNISDQCIYGQRFNATGSRIDQQFQINFMYDCASYPAITALTDGGWVVIWDNWHTTNGQRFAANGSRIGEEWVICDSHDSATGPAIAGLIDGGWIAVSVIFLHSGCYEICGQRFGADGSRIGGEFLVNTHILDRAEYPMTKVTALSDGGWVIVWISYGQDGSGWGIYSKRYNYLGQPINVLVPTVITSSLETQQLKTIDPRAQASLVSTTHGKWIWVWEELTTYSTQGYLFIANNTFWTIRYQDNGLLAEGANFAGTPCFLNISRTCLQPWQIEALSPTHILVLWGDNFCKVYNTTLFAAVFDAKLTPLMQPKALQTNLSVDVNYVVHILEKDTFLLAWQNLNNQRITVVQYKYSPAIFQTIEQQRWSVPLSIQGITLQEGDLTDLQLIVDPQDRSLRIAASVLNNQTIYFDGWVRILPYDVSKQTWVVEEESTGYILDGRLSGAQDLGLQLSKFPSGDYMGVWQSNYYTGCLYDIYVALYQKDENNQLQFTGHTLRVNDNIQGQQYQIQTALSSPTSRLLIAWISQPNAGYQSKMDIYYQLVTSSLEPLLLNETNLNLGQIPAAQGQETCGFLPETLQVIANRDGGFLISWWGDQYCDGRLQGYARRLDLDGNWVDFNQIFRWSTLVITDENKELFYTEDTPFSLYNNLINIYSNAGDVTVMLQFTPSKLAASGLNAYDTSSVNLTKITEGQWNVSGHFYHVNQAWKNLYFTPTADFNGNSQNLAFRIIDLDGTDTGWQTFDFELLGTPMNDAPRAIMGQIPWQFSEVNEDISLDLTTLIYDVDNLESALTFEVGPCLYVNQTVNATDAVSCDQQLSDLQNFDPDAWDIPCECLFVQSNWLKGMLPEVGDWCVAIEAKDGQATSTLSIPFQTVESPTVTDHLTTPQIAGIAAGTAAASLLGLLLTWKARKKYQEDTDETQAYKAGLIRQSAHTELADLRQYYLPSITRAAITSWGQSYLFYNPSNEEAVEDAESNWQPSVYISAAADDTEGYAWAEGFLIPHLEQLGFRVYFGQAHREQVTTYVVVIPSSGYSQWYDETQNESAVIEAALNRARLDKRDVSLGDGSAVIVVLRPKMSYVREMLPPILHNHEGNDIPERRLPLFTEENTEENMAVLFSVLKCIAPELQRKIQNTENRFYNHAAQVNRRTRQTIEREIRISTRGGRENAAVEGTFALESSQSSIAAEQTLPITGNQRQSHNPAFSGFPFSFFRKERSSLADERVPLLAKENNVSEVDYSLTLE